MPHSFSFFDLLNYGKCTVVDLGKFLEEASASEQISHVELHFIQIFIDILHHIPLELKLLFSQIFNVFAFELFIFVLFLNLIFK